MTSGIYYALRALIQQLGILSHPASTAQKAKSMRATSPVPASSVLFRSDGAGADEVVLRALAADREERWPTALDLARELAALVTAPPADPRPGVRRQRRRRRMPRTLRCPPTPRSPPSFRPSRALWSRLPRTSAGGGTIRAGRRASSAPTQRRGALTGRVARWTCPNEVTFDEAGLRTAGGTSVYVQIKQTTAEPDQAEEILASVRIR